MSTAAGYSGTPLKKKLGIKPDHQIVLVDEPGHYFELLETDPTELKLVKPRGQESCDFIHFFTTERSGLESRLARLKPALKKDGMLWVSWPKGKSKIPKDIMEQDVRTAGLSIGLVDIKICAVDQDWSGLKFVYRKKDR